ncbi:MAG: PAS domain-containing sensor histidine kinase [bacterium]
MSATNSNIHLRRTDKALRQAEGIALEKTARRVSEERFRLLFECSRDAIMTLEPPAWRFMSGNPATVHMFRAADEQDFTARQPWTLSPERQLDGRLSVEKAKEMIETAMREGFHYFEWTHARIGGEEFPADVLLTRIELGGKAFLQATVRDITEQKRLRTHIEISRDILHILNEPGPLQDCVQLVLAALKTRTGFDAVGIRLQDGDDFPYFAQKGLSADFLLTENTLIARTVDGGVCRDRNGNASLECTCGLVISGKIPPAHPFFTPAGSFWTNDSFPLLDLPADQDPRSHPRNICIHHGYASVALVPIRSRDQIVGLIHINDRRKGCFTLEIIELLEGVASSVGSALMRKQAEAENAKLQAQLAQARKMESEGTLARGMAHEINNPIMGIANYAQLIKDRAEGNVTLAGFADEIIAEIQRVAKMTHSLLRFTEQQAAEPFASAMPIDIVAPVLSTAERAARERGIVLSCEVPANLPPVFCCRSRISYALTALFTNALEAFEDGTTVAGNSRTILLSAQRIEKKGRTWLRLTLRNNGPIIPEVIYSRLFDPFYTTKDRTQHSGLGLWISQSIVQVNNGEISFESEEGLGTLFHVDLPVPSQT